MRREPPIAEGAFSWGKTFRLYQDKLDVNGALYPLQDLSSVHSIYRRIIGISSAHLELRFGRRRVILRGIAAIEEARKVVEHLNTWHSSIDHADIDETTQKASVLDGDATLSYASLQDTLPGIPDPESFSDLPSASLVAASSLRSKPRLSANDLSTLPTIPVPLRLLPDEQAYYRTEATLCDEPIDMSVGHLYPAKDQGTLILTNKRLVYIGRRSQIILDYAHLNNVSCLPNSNAMALQAEHWQMRKLFEIRRPSECVTYLKRMAQGAQLYAYVSDDERTKGSLATVDIATVPLSGYHWDDEVGMDVQGWMRHTGEVVEE